MSEFSASYHLKTNHREAAVRLIKQSGSEGYVYEESNGWMTFVIEGAAFDIKESVIFYNPGLSTPATGLMS
ncbi:hypothetical protein [Paenibacillus sp. FJAT-26967]|uniref:hypothetical protein n=1 Tax=Paenibacillus sp. FJAT-26967 TaxID=1729690 RepID=UPI000838B18E|nr:hypothetical protein [Paenibacillus sp. FJAT-26967]